MTSPASGAEGSAQVTGGNVQPGGGSSATGQGGAGQGAGQQQGGNGHPAWAEYLKDIPSGFHSAITPAFQKWDTDMNAKLSQVQQQYAPWQNVISGGKTPEQADAALQLLDMLEQDGPGTLMQLAEHFGVGLGDEGQGEDSGQGEGELGPSGEEGEQLPSWAQEIMQQSQQNGELLDLVAQKIVQDGQAAELEQAVDSLEQELVGVLAAAEIDRNDEHAMDYIFAQLQNGAEPQDAVQKWTAFRQALGGQQANQAAPQVLPAGGGLPTQQVDPKTLSTKDRRALAVQRIQQLQSEGSGG